jgi:hypothetical protein
MPQKVPNEIKEKIEDSCPPEDLTEPYTTTKALDTLFQDLDKSTLPAIGIGTILLIIFFALEKTHKLNPVRTIILASITGLTLVFGASELIILGVKGIADKLDLGAYVGGIISSFGAALSELVIVIILLIKGKRLIDTGEAENIVTGNEIILTAIVLILTTVLINMFFLGMAMIFTTRKKDFKLPYELTFLETNLVIGMMVFSFLFMIYGFAEKLLLLEGAPISNTFNRAFEGIIGSSLFGLYLVFLLFMFMRLRKKEDSLQIPLSDFFEGPEENEKKKKDCPKEEQDNNHHQIVSFRRFPWILVIILFIVGSAGVVFGGDALATGIETGAEEFENVPVLVYSVIVGLVSTSPELIVTFRGLMNKNKEVQQIGLINQISAINQTFFILFGVPFIISGVLGIGIPMALELTIVFGGIFILAQCIYSMILDDKAFDLFEGVLVTLVAIVSLMVLLFV